MADSTILKGNQLSKASAAEAYKTLRTNIQFSSLDKQLKVLMVTSASQSEGKSTTAANLAITIAQSDKRVLLIDSDLRRPHIHKALSLLNVKGLTNVLVQSIDYKDICNTVGVKNLEVLTSGPKPPNPSELIGTARMESLITTVASEYDTVIIDAPPVLPVTDAAVLSRLVDGVILVVEYGSTSYEMAQEAKDDLERVGANIIGAVLNRYPIEKKVRYNYEYDQDLPKKQSTRSFSKGVRRA